MAKKKKATGILPSQNYRRKVYVGVRSDGTKRYESITAPTSEEAAAAAAAYKVLVRQLRREGVAVDDIPCANAEKNCANAKKSSDTVQRYLDLYLATCEASGLSPSTMRDYARFAKNGYPALSAIRAADLTVSDIQEYVNGLKKNPKTIRNRISFLLSALRPVRPDLRADMIRSPRRERTEISIPSTEDVKKMLDAAFGTPLYIPLLLAASMGLRRSEICALTWSDVDIKGRTLTVSHALVRGLNGYAEKGTKTRAGRRTLPIPQNVVRALASERGTDPRVTKLTPAAITCRFEDLQRPIGLSYRFHDLRHYHASVMIAVGAPNAYIIEDMGHASMDMVNRVYGHVMADKKKEIHSALEEKTAVLTS